MLRRAHYAFLFHPSDAGRRAAVAWVQALTYLHKDQCSVGTAHDQINLAAATPRRPIIARQKAQTARLQIGQRLVFRCIANAFAARLVLIARKKAFL